MERLTKHHFKKQDGFYMTCSEHCSKEDFSCEDCGELDKLVDRLGTIEDILGDDYDLDRLAAIMNQRMSMREDVAERWKLTSDIPIDRLRELAQADREGRCVVLPAGGFSDQDGENALKSAMNTCYYHNNPVTRFIADAVAEKLVRAEAALKEREKE